MLPFVPPALQVPALTPPTLEAPAVLQSPLPLDLSGALSRARNENPMLRAAKARVEERRGLITSTRADALPQLTLVGDFTRVRDVSLLNSSFASSAASFGFTPESLVGTTSI